MEHNWDKYFDTTSEYWVKLQELYKLNEHYPKKKTRGMELHHKFLRCFSKLEGKAPDNNLDNLVLLSGGDHFLAHYYIWKCTNKGYRRYTCRPITLMYKKGLKYLTDDVAEQLANDWTFIVKNDVLAEFNRSRRGKKQSKEHIEAVKAANAKHLVKIINLETGEIYNSRNECPYKCYLGIKPLKNNIYGCPNLIEHNNKCVRKNIYDIVTKCFDVKSMTVDEIYNACAFTFLLLNDIKLNKTFRLIELIKHAYLNDLDIDDICELRKTPHTMTQKRIAANKLNAKNMIGSHWYTNGIDNKRLKDKEPPEGYYRGFTSKTTNLLKEI